VKRGYCLSLGPRQFDEMKDLRAVASPGFVARRGKAGN